MYGLNRRQWLLALAPGKLRALIVDGENNHDWETATRALREILEATGRFEVKVATSGTPSWPPPFASADVVILNFNSGHLPTAKRWPLAIEEDFLNYVRVGGGVVVFHAANNAFVGWKEYNEMIGLGWRDTVFGPGLIVNPRGKIEIVLAGDGPKPGHGPRHHFLVNTFKSNHPLAQGMPQEWLQESEQLTHGQHGPDAAKLTLISYAFSKDSNRREPMEWARQWGKGRVYTTMFGHTWKGEDNPNLRTAGFQSTFVRGAEWAATGRVTLPPPKVSK